MKHACEVLTVMASRFISNATKSGAASRCGAAEWRSSAVALMLVFICSGPAVVHAAWTYDFTTTGIDTNYWSTFNPYGTFAFSSSTNGVTVEGGNGSFQTAKLSLLMSRFPPLSDFSMLLTFSNASLVGGVHQIQMETSWEGGGVLVSRSNQSSEGVASGHSVNVYDGGVRNLTAVDAVGGVSSPGTFLLTRTGTVFSAYWNGALFWTGDYGNTAPLTSVNLAINNNYGASDPTAVTWLSFALSPGLLKHAQIVDYGANGRLVCTNLQPGTTASVEWASTLNGSWTNWAAAVPLDAIVVSTNGTVDVQVPMFYRVRGSPTSD
jgi:hypothetical protein